MTSDSYFGAFTPQLRNTPFGSPAFGNILLAALACGTAFPQSPREMYPSANRIRIRYEPGS